MVKMSGSARAACDQASKPLTIRIITPKKINPVFNVQNISVHGLFPKSQSESLKNRAGVF